MAIQVKEKFFYASGAVANGVKTDAFTFFLLFFPTDSEYLSSLVIGLQKLGAQRPLNRVNK